MKQTTFSQNQLFLSRELLRLLPEVFFHPIWIHFSRNNPNYSPDLIQNLLHDLQPEQTQGDPATKCQIMFLCAFLHSRLGDHAGAQVCIEQALNLAETHGLEQICRCAAWGSCAMCIWQGKYQEAVDWLIRLQSKLKEKGEWILANVLELFKQTLEGQAWLQDPNGEHLEWLLRWGEWPGNIEFAYLSEDSQSARPVDFPIAENFSHLTSYWWSFRQNLKLIISSIWTRKRQPDQNVSSSAYQDKHEELSRSAKVSPLGQKLFASNVDLMQEKFPSSLGIPNASNPNQLTQSILSPGSQASSPAKKVSPSLAVYCLGPFRVYQDDQSITTWPSGKGKAIFKYMIANMGRPIHKDILIDTFWRETDPEAGRKNLYVAIHGLRQAFKSIQPNFPVILFQDEHYLLNPAMAVWVDTKEFLEHYQAGQRLERNEKLAEAVGEYEVAESLYQGDFLEEDLYEDWPILQREGLKDSYLAILDRLSQYYLEERRYATCIQLCQKILAKDDCREDAHRRLMSCYSRQGQRHLALRQYHLCVEILARVLNVVPAPETTALYQRIHGGERV